MYEWHNSSILTAATQPKMKSKQLDSHNDKKKIMKYLPA